MLRCMFNMSLAVNVELPVIVDIISDLMDVANTYKIKNDRFLTFKPYNLYNIPVY